jgi:glutaryl-CoA dehydrogenase
MSPESTGKVFRWEDPLDLASRLSDDERLVQHSARDYARERLLPRVVTAYAQERFDREILNEMGSLGLLGAMLPAEYGCAGVGHVAYGLIAREIESIDSGYRSAMSVQSSLPFMHLATRCSDDDFCPAWHVATSSGALL